MRRILIVILVVVLAGCATPKCPKCPAKDIMIMYSAPFLSRPIPIPFKAGEMTELEKQADENRKRREQEQQGKGI